MTQGSGFRGELERVVEGRHLKNTQCTRRGPMERSANTVWRAAWRRATTTFPNRSRFPDDRFQAPPDVVEMELENYSDELNPDNPHPALFLRFIDACGEDAEAVRHGRGLPSTEMWTEWLWGLAKHEPWQAAVAAIHVGSEFQAPGTFNAILPALREKYQFTEHEIEHFWLHAEVDIEHSGSAFDVLERHCTTPELRDMAAHYVSESIRRRWFFMDCVYLYYDKGELKQGAGG